MSVCLSVGVNAAAASGSPALSASGFGITHDPSAPGLDSAQPARRHLQLRPPVAVQHPRVSRAPGQGGQELPTGPRATARTTQTNPTSLHRDALILCRKRGRTTPSVYSFSFTGWVWFNISLSLSFTTATLYSVWFICFSLVVFAKALLLLLLILGVSDLNKPPSLSIQLQHVTHLKSCVLLRRGVLLL